MAHPQQPNMAYQPQEPMSEKLQPNVQVASGSKFGNKWSSGLFDCCSPFSTCCLGYWCPCVVFGKTYARDHGDGESSGCNAMCCLWYTAAIFGFHSCFQCIMRGQQREKYGIEGGAAGDFCASLCCACCVLVQSEKESVVRVTGIDPKTNVAYQPITQGMQYPA